MSCSCCMKVCSSCCTMCVVHVLRRHVINVVQRWVVHVVWKCVVHVVQCVLFMFYEGMLLMLYKDELFMLYESVLFMLYNVYCSCCSMVCCSCCTMCVVPAPGTWDCWSSLRVCHLATHSLALSCCFRCSRDSMWPSERPSGQSTPWCWGHCLRLWRKYVLLHMCYSCSGLGTGVRQSCLKGGLKRPNNHSPNIRTYNLQH